jgi:flagellar hook-basal body complex protein FliE
MKLLGLKAYGFEPMQPIAPNLGENADKITPDKKSVSFGEMFTKAVEEVDQAHRTADGQMAKWLTGGEGVSTHEAMIALEKADVSFQLLNAVRSKIVRAYEEVMRTQV